MKVWAIANQKGGVGKTTTAISLAGHLVKQGGRILLVDLDPHGSMTSYFGYDPDSLEASIYQLFQGEAINPGIPPDSLLLDTSVDGIKLLPASTALATLDRQLGSKEGKGLVMTSSLSQLKQQFDYALIDCPPLLGILMVNALAACEQLIMPVQTEYLAIKGLERMMNTLKMIIKARKDSLRFTIVPTMFDRRTRAALESLRSLREQYQEDVWDSVIPVDTKFREASQMGEPLPQYLPSSRGAKAYDVLTRYLQNDRALTHLKLVQS